MVPKKHRQSVCIHITTYKTALNKLGKSMNAERRHLKAKKFMCSICLNTNGRSFGKGMITLCPVCEKNSNGFNENIKITNKFDDSQKLAFVNKAKLNKENHNTKTLLKTERDFTQGLNLLNEVLTVFKCKKDIEKEKPSKTVIFKDVGTSTDNNNINTIRELAYSKIFLCSVENNKYDENCKFTIVNCSQPKRERIIDLKKHKSSSIPQMRMEQLQNSLKEKTKAKDVVEEVKQMFATVNINQRVISLKKSDETNRPVTRKGPRVLPVVKTKTHQDVSTKHSCKCCQTSEYFLSSGDSFVKPNENQKRCDKCVYMLCCHYQKNHSCQTGVVVCRNCHNVIEKRCNCDKSFEIGCCENVE